MALFTCSVLITKLRQKYVAGSAMNDDSHNSMIISPARFWKSFRYARHGLARAMATEHSFRVHVLVAIVVVLGILLLKLNRAEAAVLILLVSSILTLELVNTVVERFVDMLEPRMHPYVGVIKDLMAAGVLITSIAAAVIGIVIFWPYLTPLWA